ncbi:MAG: hypothetical protein GY950_03845, partial [bacterium]|nr:hypothetical protein [bacterium]
EFEKANNVRIDELDTHKYEGKRLRTQLLVQLKDRGGLTYPEIVRMPLFKELKQGSLGRLYGRGKERMQEE